MDERERTVRTPARAVERRIGSAELAGPLIAIATDVAVGRVDQPATDGDAEA